MKIKNTLLKKHSFFNTLLLAGMMFSASFAGFSQNGVGINATGAAANAAAMLDVTSTSKGVLFPRMTTAQRDAIASPVAGLTVYNISTSTFDYYNGTVWVSISANGVTGSGTISYVPKWTTASSLGNSLIYDNGTSVGIGTTSPGLVSGSVSKYLTLSSGTGNPGVADAFSLELQGGSSSTGSTQNKIDFIARATDGSNYNTGRIEMANTASSTSQGRMLFHTRGANFGPRMVIDELGNVGIGTISPASSLHSSGQIRTGIPLGGLGGALPTTGSVLFYNASNTNTVNIQSGVTSTSYSLILPTAQGSANSLLTNNGSGTLSWNTASSLVGSGTQNYITKWNNSGGTTIGNSQITDDGSQVVVGTASGPQTNAKLDVVGNNTATDGTNGVFLDVQNSSNTTNNLTGIRFTGSSAGSYLKTAILVPYTNGAWGVSDMIFALNNVNSSTLVSTADSKMIIKSSGNVGIGLTNPTYKLEVSGDIRSSGYLYLGTSTSQYFFGVAGSYMGASDHFIPNNTNTQDLGTTSWRWRTIYAYDVNAVNNYSYSSAQTRYETVSHAAFVLAANSASVFAYHYISGGPYLLATSGGTAGTACRFVAPVNLPDGATVTKVEAFVYDNDATYNCTVNLRQQTWNSSINTAMSTATSTSGGQATLTSTTITNPVIDKTNYAYYLEFITTEANTLLGVYNVRITYTVTKAD